MIDRRSDRPRYRQLADILRDQIRTGALAPNAWLPSESQLVQTYEVSRDSARDAVAVLRQEGLVVTERGRGTRVRAIGDRQQFDLRSGDRITARMPGHEESRTLDLDPGVPLLEVRRANQTKVYPADGYELTVP